MKGLLFTYGLTVTAVLASLFRPYYGFLGYVALSTIKPESLWPWSVPESNYTRYVAVAFLLGWFVHGMGTWRFRQATPIVVALIAYWAWLVISAAISPAKEESWYTLEIMTKVFIPLIAGLTLIDSLEKLKQLAWVLALAHGLLAFQFNAQYYSYGIDTDEWLFAGLDNNSIAITMVTAMGLTIFLGIAADNWWQRGAALVLALLMGHVVLFSMSRGGMLAMCVSMSLAFILTPKRPVYYLGLVVAVAILIRLAGADVRQEFLTSFGEEQQLDESARSRYQLTRDALDCMWREPLFGCGMENWGNVAPQYGWPKGKRAHNTWAELGATLGVPGLAAILAFYGICCWRMLQLSSETSFVGDPWARWMARAILAGLTGFAASAWFVTVDRIELPYYIVLLGTGVLKVLVAPDTRSVADRVYGVVPGYPKLGTQPS